MGRLRNEEGFSLTELLVGMIVGLVVIFASLQLLDHAFISNREVLGRTDAAQRARRGISEVTRLLRSQICVGPGRPSIVAASDNSVSFYADFGDGSTPPAKHTITFDPVSGIVTEYDYPGTGLPPATTFAASPSPAGGRLLLTDTRLTGTTAFFRYYGFDTTGARQPTLPIASPVSSANLSQVVRVAVAFTTRASGPANGAETAEVQNDVSLRSADPTNAIAGCS